MQWVLELVSWCMHDWGGEVNAFLLAVHTNSLNYISPHSMEAS
jgi:hypothetical protein